MKEIQIRFLETMVSLLGKVNAGVDLAHEAINGALDFLQGRATKVMNDRIDRLADELFADYKAKSRAYLDKRQEILSRKK